MPLINIADPGLEPVTAAEVKDAGRIDGTEFDAQIAILIPAYRRQAEEWLGRRLITQTVELVLDEFPESAIDLHMPGVQSIESVKYIDTDGVEQTLAAANYSLDDSSTPNYVLPAYGTSWPDVLDSANVVRVRMVVGYGDAAADVPEEIRTWIKAHVIQTLDNPSGVTSDKVHATLPFLDGLLNAHKVWAC